MATRVRATVSKWFKVVWLHSGAHQGQLRSFQEAKGEVEQCIGLVGTTCDGKLRRRRGPTLPALVSARDSISDDLTVTAQPFGRQLI